MFFKPRSFWFLSALFSLFFSQAFPVILPIDALSHLQGRLGRLTQEDCIILHVEETLLLSEDVVLRSVPKCDAVRNQYMGQLKSLLNTEEFLERIGAVYIKRKESVLDPHAKGLIGTVEKLGVPIFATSRIPVIAQAGAAGFLPEWRFNEMLNLGFSFSATFPKVNTLFLDSTEEGVEPACFHKGILFFSRHDIGSVVVEFLQKNEFYPHRVIVIDSHRENLEKLEVALGELNIRLLGFHYVPSVLKEAIVNPETVERQFHHLLENKEWLSDEEAS